MSHEAISQKKRWETLLGATLETWAHQLLYNRHVYPRETFGNSRFLGVQCRVNRHPDVVRYIEDITKLAAPSIVSGVADEVTFVIVESDQQDGATEEIERYRLSFTGMKTEWKEMDNIVRLFELAERAMRDLVLRVQSLEDGRASSSNSVSFRITLHIPEEDMTCNELNLAFSQGKVVATDSMFDSTRGSTMTKLRPLQSLDSPVCHVDFFMLRSEKSVENKANGGVGN